ncbi:DUF1156 domain-containing protein [Blastopirellula sp. J2-11]|uniref:DUF1156 domain-containing protein n=1 Tax=Blastopirellula sp. J2-11 TaxID=2943192 RepID=UPI0021C8ED5D|nr:DUF1156 domain-containing protein [Blastopirellula sp. J2-11]UUO07890.1 DUF1156 domain-containing protein [Blastopirellula sp. J2-11]
MSEPAKYPKRLIEVDLPIARISAHARREKSIRHGHISTLHIWWARRPLASCRAVICASLWPDPADELCPTAFREAAVVQIKQFAGRIFPKKITSEGKLLASEKHLSQESRGRWEAIAAGSLTLDADEPTDMPMLRMCLLDFIADFANWDNSAVSAYLETSRALTQAAHQALGGEPGTRPLVVDPFAGGGAIPLEALRVGGDAFASDLNPVAVLLNKVVLEYIPKYGKKLADEIRKWGDWVQEQVQQELADVYPKDPDGATPIAYLWARTILSEGPGGGTPIEVPLLRSMWLCKKRNRKIALRWLRNKDGAVLTDNITVQTADGQHRNVLRPQLEIFVPDRDTEVEAGTVSQGSATCPVTHFTTPVQSVRDQLSKRFGGAADSRLLAIAVISSATSGRQYRLPTSIDDHVVSQAYAKLSHRKGELTQSPKETFSGTEPRRIPVPQYGIHEFSHLFHPRQLLAMLVLTDKIKSIGNEAFNDAEMAIAVRVMLTLSLGKHADLANSLCAWEPIAECPRHLFGKQAINMVWDFAEGVTTGKSSGSWSIQIDRMVHILESIGQDWQVGTVQQSSATEHPLPNDIADCFLTDPPYYYSVPYSDLSDFFYVWFRRSLSGDLPKLFSTEVTPKKEECVQNLPHAAVKHRQKDRAFYEKQMETALAEGRRITKPAGIATIVFAHSSTDAWESLLEALVRAGWQVTASWPIDTEMASRIVAQRQRTLASSVHLVCRPREKSDGSLREETGEWRDVLSELPKRIHEWMPRLAAEGVVGADAIFACLGPALEIFSRYSRVEKASGEAVPLREYLEQVWATVSTEALSMIFKDADAAGLEPDARLTAMWLWTLGGMETNGSNSQGSSDSDEKVVASKGYTLEYDTARKIAQGLGIHLEQSESIVEVKGDKARLLPASERTRHLFGKDEPGPTTSRGRKKKNETQLDLFKMLDALEAEAEVNVAGELKPQAGDTVLDRVHQSMILFASGRGEALRRFLVDDGAGTDARFWKLAQSLSALYLKETDEKRWVDGVLARKKGLGL